MKLKTLLLGSAAAMMAVTGAQAADAVVAEPEPVEYVRVCDMYGNGFFYIPGTETCLNFNGYVRVEYQFDNNEDGVQDTDDFAYRARFNIDTRNETDYGTLRAQIRFQGDSAGDGAIDAGVGVDRALISLGVGNGQIRLGYSDGFTTTLHGYGLPLERNDGFYGFDQATFLDYTYSANGFSFGFGVQDSLAEAGGVGDYDYYVGGSYGGSIGSLAASYIYEDDDDVSAWKVSAELTAVDNLTVKGFYVGDDGDDSREVEGNGDLAWGVGAEYAFNSDFAVNVGYSATNGNDETDFVAFGARWNPVPGLSIRPEIKITTDGPDDQQEYSVRVYRLF